MPSAPVQEGWPWGTLRYGSSYQTVIAIATARRVVVLPAAASQPLSLSALKATLVLRTVTFDFASQSLTCLSTANLRAGEGLDLHRPARKKRPRV